MATVLDAARTVGVKQAHNTEYQNGNDDANTPTPTWLDTITFATVAAETHIDARGEAIPWAPTNNTADAWVPHATIEWLDSVPATERF